jgi:hypothetical protein
MAAAFTCSSGGMSGSAALAASPWSCAVLMPVSEHTRMMVSASSSTNTATGAAPCCTASAAICAAVLMLTARFAPGHSNMPAGDAAGDEAPTRSCTRDDQLRGPLDVKRCCFHAFAYL